MTHHAARTRRELFIADARISLASAMPVAACKQRVALPEQPIPPVYFSPSGNTGVAAGLLQRTFQADPLNRGVAASVIGKEQFILPPAVKASARMPYGSSGS